MPGADDPTNFTMPQQPFHQCLLPRAARYSTLKRVTNPYEAYIGRRMFLGASGQILDDLKKYTTPSKSFKVERGNGDAMEVDEQQQQQAGNSSSGSSAWGLELMQQLLKWRHMAPTAPDTLPCYPFCDIDPFVLRECPHVFFCANQVIAAPTPTMLSPLPLSYLSSIYGVMQDDFGTCTMTGEDGQEVRIVLIPCFEKTKKAVLINLRTLEATTLHFPGLVQYEGEVVSN